MKSLNQMRRDMPLENRLRFMMPCDSMSGWLTSTWALTKRLVVIKSAQEPMTNAYKLLMPLIVQEVSHDAHKGIKCEKGKENRLHCVAT